MSDTPLTDAVSVDNQQQPLSADDLKRGIFMSYVSGCFARQLERENAKLRAFVEECATDRDDRISGGLKRKADLLLQNVAAGNV